VTFTSHLDGSRHRLTPEDSIRVQEQLGADLVLAFDEPTSPLHDEQYTAQALGRTHRWAQRSLEAHRRADQALFGIVQGGAFQRLREKSAAFIGSLPFEGFAIGGSLGKSKADMQAVLEWSVPSLPSDRPRHLLGIGEPEDLFACVERGVDLFDCVAPTRFARHGVLYTRRGKLNITNVIYRQDDQPIEQDCPCYTCQNFSRAYLRHLILADELLAYTLNSIHNLHLIVNLVEAIRRSIERGTFDQLKEQWLARYQGLGDGGWELGIGDQSRPNP
jgi:tRNA-guanine transglycosylase